MDTELEPAGVEPVEQAATTRWPDVHVIRQELGLSQQDLADLLGVSTHTVQSVEQGWRHFSPCAERGLLLILAANRLGPRFTDVRCWEINNCPLEGRDECVSYRTRQGSLCWFLSGNFCCRRKTGSWTEKKEICRRCALFRVQMGAAVCDTVAVDRPPVDHKLVDHKLTNRRANGQRKV